MAGLHNFELSAGKGDTTENYYAARKGQSGTIMESTLEMRQQLKKFIKCLCSEEEKFI